MARQVILGQLDEVLGRRLAAIGKDLVEYMGAELLDANVVVSSGRGDCARVVSM